MADQERQPHSELASFGEELRREREIRGISLKEISDSTKISKRFLEAIERNDHKTLPAPVFTRGFVREYARYLGLNAEEMVNRYNYAAAGDDRIEKTEHLERLVEAQKTPQAVVETPVRPKGIPPVYARIDRNVYIAVILVVALLGVAYWAVKHKRESRAEAAEASKPLETATAPPTLTPAPVATTSTAGATADDALHLTIDLTENSWINLEADGKTVYNDELHRGEHRTFEAKDRFRFKTIGNAGGVSLIINDVKVPVLGRAGEVLHDRVFDRQALQQIRDSVRTDT